MFTQDTTKVVNTKQLDNKFTILTGMKYDPRRSTASTKVYESIGVILSIKNYNDDNLVEQCYRQGCDYNFLLVAHISSASRYLEVDVGYVGGAGLNQQIFLSEIHLALGV